MKLGILGIACVAFTLAACADPNITPATSAQVDAKVKSVQSYTRTLCKFVPVASVVTSIFNVAIGESVDAIGKGICSAFDVAPLADGPGRAVPMYRGVELRGSRV